MGGNAAAAPSRRRAPPNVAVRVLSDVWSRSWTRFSTTGEDCEMTLPDDYRDLDRLDDYDIDEDLDNGMEDLEDDNDAQFASDDELDDPTTIDEDETFTSLIEPGR